MHRLRTRIALLLAVLTLLAAACGGESTEDMADAPGEGTATTAPEPTDPASQPAGTEEMTEPEPSTTPETTEEMTEGTTGEMASSAEICDPDALVAAVEGGAEEGTLSGMADDPVATAASSNPVLTTLATAVGAAGLGDTLNSAEALTVFAPTDCAFAALDPATLEAALADPEGLLTSVLGFHVVVGEQLSAADLAGTTELETFTGETLTVEASGDTIRVGGQAEVLVPDIQTANATVHLIDAVMVPGEG